MTLQEATKLVASMLAAIPNHRVRPADVPGMCAVWARLLADVPYELADRALSARLETSPFLPSVADLRATVSLLRSGGRRTGLDGWGSVLRAIGAEGVYRSPGVEFQFRDPIVARVVAAMGWENLCNSENQAADRARFIEAYEVIGRQYAAEDQSPTLQGAAADRAIAAGDVVSLIAHRLAASKDGKP